MIEDQQLLTGNGGLEEAAAVLRCLLCLVLLSANLLAHIKDQTAGRDMHPRATEPGGTFICTTSYLAASQQVSSVVHPQA
jgi:hypothetical protein